VSARRLGTRQTARNSHSRGGKSPGRIPARSGWPDRTRWLWPRGLDCGVAPCHLGITCRRHGHNAGIERLWTRRWWTVECTARLLEITRHASRANWPIHLHLKRGTRYEPAASRLELRLVRNPPISPLRQVYAAAFASSPALQACCRSLVRFASNTRAIMGDLQSPKAARTGVSDPFSPAVHHVSEA